MKRKIGLAVVGLCLSLDVAAQWQQVYRHDDTGNALAGSKDALFTAVRQGLPIRLGWGVKKGERSVEHVAVPEFLTITSEQEVFVQIPAHIAQTSYWDTEFQDFNAAQVTWRGLLSTTGRFMAVWYNRHTGETVRRYPQRVAMTWFADLPDTPHSGPVTPLYNEKEE